MTPGTSLTPPSVIERARRLTSLGALLGLAVCAVAWSMLPQQFIRSYLVAYLFWLGLAMGSLSLALLHRLTGGQWGDLIHRILVAATRTLPLMAVLFLPVALNLDRLYPWAQPETVARDEILQHKAVYLNASFFQARALVYFVAWLLLAYFLGRWSRRLEDGRDEALARRLRKLAGGGLVVLALTITLASVDWAMSLNPHWFSAIYGVLFLIGQVLGALALSLVVLALLVPSASPGALSKTSLHDLGKLLFAFVMLWAYVSFSQFLIIWSANLPEEAVWYLRRLENGWQYLALALIVFHFVLPFMLLLSYDLKRRPALLGSLAAGILVARYLDLYWLVAPDMAPHGHHGIAVHALDLVVPLAVGLVWLTYFAWNLDRRPPLGLAAAPVAGGEAA